MQKLFLILVFLGTMQFESVCQQNPQLLGLNGTWRFSIGDDMERAAPKFDDSQWDFINAPSAWEEQGYYGYDGYAWYRKEVYFQKAWRSVKLQLHMGFIDDVDEVYFNGHLIGKSGSFPPKYKTAYTVYRTYTIPSNYIVYGGNNVIAVRVFDAELSGGILRGDLGIYLAGYQAIPDLDLSGQWRFFLGDNPEWKEPSWDDKRWAFISVPSFWEKQGYDGYDGVAWYRKKFKLPENLANKTLVLMLGKIDDIDEVYLNGQLIGSTGHIKQNPKESELGEYYQKFRGYYIPKGLLKTKGENTLVVRVYDGFVDGGIYEGPVGIITSARYVEFWKSQPKPAQQNQNSGFWDWLFN